MPAIRGEMATGFFEVGARVSGQAAAEILKEHPEYTPRKSGAAPAPHWDSTEEADMVYRTLVDRVKGGDFSVDFRTLRLACLKSSQCQPRSTPEELSEMQLAHSGHQLNRAIEIAERLINKGFVNAEVHAECFRLYSEIGDNSKASFHLQTAAALLTSILSLGDGKTKETAFEVISDREEFSVLASMGLPYFGSDVLSNSPLIDGEHHYDRWSVRNPKTGEAVELFFNTDYFVPGKSRVGNQ